MGGSLAGQGIETLTLFPTAKNTTKATSSDVICNA